MNIILLSGGSGKRLWPLSNDVRSKQFIKLFKNNDEYESMVQRVYRQITVDADAKITIATSKSQASAIKNQLGEKASICVEPCRRDTFPAIALAAAYLHDEMGVAENEAVVDYFKEELKDYPFHMRDYLFREPFSWKIEKRDFDTYEYTVKHGMGFGGIYLPLPQKNYVFLIEQCGVLQRCKRFWRISSVDSIVGRDYNRRI